MSSDYLKALDIGSGLNTSQIVDAIVNAEKVPKEKRINNKIEARETQISSFSEIKSNLSSLQSNLSIYDGVNGLSLNKNGTSVTASITDKSKAGQFTHEIGVSSLAKAPDFRIDGFLAQRINWHWFTWLCFWHVEWKCIFRMAQPDSKYYDR